MPNEYSVSNLRHFIHRGIVDRPSLIWSYYNLCCLFFVTWLTIPDKYGTTVNEAEHFCVTQHLYGSIHKFIVFVHEPPY